MESERSDQSLRVAVRVRPVQERERGKEEVVFCEEQTIKVSDDSRFTRTQFDAVFPAESTQEQVYAFVSPLVPGLSQGYNASVFAYGQTGSGKTFTMFGEQWDVEDLGNFPERKPLGIVPRLLIDLFQPSNSQDYSVYCSFLEIYNEKVYDLLQESEQELAIREEKESGVFVEGLAEFVVQTARDSVTLMKRGERSRAVRETRMNRNSSRSHCVFQVSMERDRADQSGRLSRSKLSLCDLAGSEKFDRERKMAAMHLREMNKINLSLTTLGKVVSCLAQRQVHVPYRDSKLTRLLMDSLGGNTKTFIVATVSPLLDHLDETVSTLHFASRARCVSQTVTKNEVSATDDKLVSKLQREIQHLKELLQLKRKGLAGRTEIQQRLWTITEENERLRAALSQQEVEELKRENKRMRLELQKLYETAPVDSVLNSALQPLSPHSESAPRENQWKAARSEAACDQPVQMRIRGKHNITQTKNTTIAAILAVDRETLQEKKQLRRTHARLQSLERLETLQRQRIEKEILRVEEAQRREEEGRRNRETDALRRKAQKQLLKSNSEQRRLLAQDRGDSWQQSSSKPKPERLQRLLRELV